MNHQGEAEPSRYMTPLQVAKELQLSRSAVYNLLHAGELQALALFPYEQLLTEGTQPVFALASRYVWAGLSGLAAIRVWTVLRWRAPVVHAVMWIGVFAVGGAWFSPLLAAVLAGAGSPMAVVFWLAAYGPFALGAVSYALKNR